jgi:serine/threonine protein phosphatase PrpC/ectoine hydroxylase-related dioxygenase (phytanoyl-CoA dioxygenase family)
MPKRSRKQQKAASGTGAAMAPLASFCVAASILASAGNIFAVNAFIVDRQRTRLRVGGPYRWRLDAPPPLANSANAESDGADKSADQGQTAPPSAQQRSRYVTPVGKNEMSDLIERLGLKKVDNNGKKREQEKNQRTSKSDETEMAPKDVVSGDDGIDEGSEASRSRQGGASNSIEDNAWDTIVTAVTTQKLVDIVSSKLSASNTDEMTQIEENNPLSPSLSHILDQTQDISLQTQLDYSRNGHAALRSFLAPELIQKLRDDLVEYSSSRTLQAYQQKVEVAQSAKMASKCTTVEACIEALIDVGIPAESLPFLQHFNAWKSVVSARSVAKSARLAHAAATLLDVPSVRLYQDSIFHKRPGDGPTPWHSDARMAPFDTSKIITFWINLQPVPDQEVGGTGLVFADGSHADFALPYWNGIDGREYERLEERYSETSHHMPMKVGDCTVHAGWTLHCADEAIDERIAYAVTFVDSKAEVREVAFASKSKGDDEDKWSYSNWIEEVPPRRVFRHPAVPIVWPKMLLPKDLIKERGAVEALQKLRSGKNKQEGMKVLESAGNELAGGLTMTGNKGSYMQSKQINQDRAVILSPFSVKSSSGSSIFAGTKRLLLLGDGHNQFGEAVSTFLCDELPFILAENLNDVQAKSLELSEEELLAETMEAIADAFEDVDTKGRLALAPPSGGSTATLVLQLGKYAFVANCGDSTSFFATYNKNSGATEIIYTTREDKPELEDEKQRIEEAGGSVMMPEDKTSGEVARVVGVDENGTFFGGIATSRSIGDWEFSDDLGITPQPSAVDGVDLSDIVATGELEVFAVCCCDGVTDALDLDDVASTIAKGLYDSKGPHLLTSLEHIMNKARHKWDEDTGGTYRDDMTIIASALTL